MKYIPLFEEFVKTNSEINSELQSLKNFRQPQHIEAIYGLAQMMREKELVFTGIMLPYMEKISCWDWSCEDTIYDALIQLAPEDVENIRQQVMRMHEANYENLDESQVDLKFLRISDNVFFVKVFGHEYGYKLKPGAMDDKRNTPLTLEDLRRKVETMISAGGAGRALAYIKQKTDLFSGSKR